MAETLKFGNLTIHFLGENAVELRNTFNRVYGSAAARTGSHAFRNEISETARYFKNIHVGGSLQDLEQVPGYKDDPIRPASGGAPPKAAFGKALGADTYVMVVPGREHTLLHGGRSFPGSTELAMAHEFLHPPQLIREWARTGILTRRDDGGSETQVQMREQRIAIELGMVVGRDFPDIIGTETGYEVRLKPSENQPRLPDEINPIRPQPSVPPIDGGTNQKTPANGAPRKHGALDQDRTAGPARDTLADRFGAGAAAASRDRPLVPASFGTARAPGSDRDAVANRMTEIQTLMGDRHSEYWQGPKADTLQQEYRDLVEASEQAKTFGESVSRSPEAARTLIGSSINVDARPTPDDGALTDRMAELQTLMADRHSDYWRGPEADALQQEYRDLIDRRDRRKRREQELFVDDRGGSGALDFPG